MYWFKCCRCTASSVFPVLSNNNNILLLLRETHNALHLRVFFFSSSRIRNIDIFGAKKYFLDHRTANTFSYLFQ